MHGGQRGEGCTLDTELRVRAGHPGRVAAYPEVLERVQPGTRLGQQQRQQGKEDDRPFAVPEQDSHLVPDLN